MRDLLVDQFSGVFSATALVVA